MADAVEQAPEYGAQKKPKMAKSPPDIFAGLPHEHEHKRLIYLGPTLIDGAFVLKSNTIYANGLPPEVAERVKADADLAKFFVHVTKTAKVMGKLSDADSDLSATYNNIKNNYLNKRKRG